MMNYRTKVFNSAFIPQSSSLLFTRFVGEDDPAARGVLPLPEGAEPAVVDFGDGLPDFGLAGLVAHDAVEDEPPGVPDRALDSDEQSPARDGETLYPCAGLAPEVRRHPLAVLLDGPGQPAALQVFPHGPAERLRGTAFHRDRPRPL